MNRKEANALFADRPTKPKINPSFLVVEIIGPPKWGKTKFFMDNKRACLLAFETGHKFQTGFKIEIDCWKAKNYPITKDSDKVPHMTAMQALDVIEASDAFDFVSIDTVDMATRMCKEYMLDQKNLEHESDMAMGKGYEIIINAPMRQFILRILKSGKGVGLITHTKVEVERYSTGEKARKESTLPKGVKAFVESQADVIMHGELGKRRGTNRLRDRIMVCDGDMDILAGNRSGGMLPQRYIVDPVAPWKQFAAFFSDPTACDKAELDYKRAYRSQ